MSSIARQLSGTKNEFQSWKDTALLCKTGHRDEALVLFVFHTPFSRPDDTGCASIAEKGSDEALLLLDRELPWCVLPRLQAERIIRLLRAGQLALHVNTFQPNSPDVLTGKRARLSAPVSLAGLPPARQQPREGFSNPHHLRASLQVGPKADLAEIRRLIDRLGS